jgi:hypothetical protein
VFDFSQITERGNRSVCARIKKGENTNNLFLGFNNKKTNYSPQYKSKKEDEKERK